MQDKRVIYAVIKLTEVAKVKEIVNKIDPQAFMIISDASEVVGRGFTTSPVNNCSSILAMSSLHAAYQEEHAAGIPAPAASWVVCCGSWTGERACGCSLFVVGHSSFVVRKRAR